MDAASAAEGAAPPMPLQLVDAQSLDAQRAELTAAAVWRPPIVSPLLPEGIRST